METKPMPDRKSPLVFGIGLPHSGGRWLAAAFSHSGYVWQHKRGGKLAADIGYARARGRVPLGEWPNAVGFSGLYRDDKPHLPRLRVQDSLTFLVHTFPDAYFIRTRRDPADWVAARFLAQDGTHRADAAQLANVPEAELLDHWLAEDQDYDAQCAQMFAGDARFLDINIDAQPIDIMAQFLSDDYLLERDFPNPVPALSARDMSRVVDTVQAAPLAPEPPAVDMNFVTQAVDFMIGTTGHKGNAKALSQIAVHWNETGDVVPIADTAPIVKDADGVFQMHAASGLTRALGTLHEAQAHGLKPPLYVDMMDARFLGSGGRRTAPRRTLAFNRRKGAPNLVLWPLPAYQSLKPSGTPGGFPADTLAFEDKTDQAVWFGNMTGRMSPVLTPEGVERRGVYPLRDEMLNLAPDAPAWADIERELMCVPRYRMVKTLRGHPDFKVGFVLRSTWQKLERSPAFDGLTEAMQPLSWFHQYRYVISIAGNDMGSNFLNTAASNSLVLKEEDDWELIYSHAFKPWVHYVPLQEGALDLEEKLAWARAHPDESAAIARASREMYDRFANPNNRSAILRALAARMNASA